MSENERKTVRLLVVDDHEVVRTGLERLLDRAGKGLQVVASAECGDKAVALAVQHQPDVVLMDVRLDDADGLDVLIRIRDVCPSVAIVVLSGYQNPTYIARAVVLGAADYVLKDAPLDQLVDAIQRAAAGQPPSVQNAMAPIRASMAGAAPASASDLGLSNREAQVLRHLALGLSNKEIARSLAISVDTVKEHVQKVLRKLDATDRTQAAVWAVKHGFLPGVTPPMGDP